MIDWRDYTEFGIIGILLVMVMRWVLLTLTKKMDSMLRGVTKLMESVQQADRRAVEQHGVMLRSLNAVRQSLDDLVTSVRERD